MTQQPKVLQIANEFRPTMPSDVIKDWCKEAVTELRRLHVINTELLKALEDTLDNMEEWGSMASLYEQERYGLQADINIAKAAIAKAIGEKQ
jgi:hypothetical protein